jgi:hypothetical protein
MADLSIQNLSAILLKYPDIGRAFQQVLGAINNLGQQANSAPVGAIPAPPPVSQLSVTGGAGTIHAVISDGSPTYRGNSYTLEIMPAGGKWETDALPIHLGPSRAWRGFLGSGNYDVRACSGYDTSNPSPWVYALNIAAVGSTVPPFPKSTGSGTGGGGWGNVPFNGSTPPKRG